MAQQTIDHDALVECLFEIFRNHGYEGTTISQLSEQTGLKKSSLYHRFPDGKADMAKAVVAHVGALVEMHVITPLRDTSSLPEQRFNSMLATVKNFYCDGKKNCLLNVLCLGDANHEIKTKLNQTYDAWLNALIDLSIEAGHHPTVASQKSQHFLTVLEGALVIQRLTEKPEVFEKSLAYEKLQFFN